MTRFDPQEFLKLLEVVEPFIERPFNPNLTVEINTNGDVVGRPTHRQLNAANMLFLFLFIFSTRSIT